MMFEVGQKIVCVQTHRQGFVQEGQVYIVDGLDTCSRCGLLILSVGIKLPFGTTKCGCLNVVSVGTRAWFSSKLFRPLDDLYNEEIEQLMEEVNEEFLIPIEA